MTHTHVILALAVIILAANIVLFAVLCDVRDNLRNRRDRRAVEEMFAGE